MSDNNEIPNNPSSVAWYNRIGRMIQGLSVSLLRTTLQYFRNIPSRIINCFRTRMNERKRLPRRNRPNRIYVLVGYTTQAQIDRKFRNEKFAHNIRNFLIFCVVLIIIILSYRSIIPFIDSEQYKQMLGIEDVGEMTKNDPFEADSSDKVMTFETEITISESETENSITSTVSTAA